MRFGQQMRRAWRRDALRGKVPANIQIRGIFPLLNCLVACACVARCFLLSADVVTQFPVARFKLAPGARDIFFNRSKFRFRGIQFFLGQTRSLRAAKPRPHQFCSSLRKSRPSCTDTGRSRFQVGGRRIERMQIGELFQEIAIGGFVFLNASFYGNQLALADVNVAFRLVALLDERLFFRL